MKKQYKIPPKPMAPTAQDQARWEHSGLRHRLLTGVYEEDIYRELYRHLPADRVDNQGPADMSSNPFEQVTRQLAVLYTEPPIVTHEDEQTDISSLVSRKGYVTRSGLFQMMQRGQQLALGMREVIVKIDVVPHVMGSRPRRPGIQYRIVTPDYVYCESHPDSPDQPIYYQELRLRTTATGEPMWIADVLDIRNEEDPIFGMYKVEADGSLSSDVSEEFMGHPTHRGLGENGYPYLDGDGVPFLPLEIYRAEKTGQLWNAYDNAPLLWGSLSSNVLYSMWHHSVLQSAWPQRYIAGLQLAGMSGQDLNSTARRATVTTDPTSVLVFNTDQDMQGQPMIGQFEAGVDPEKLLTAIAQYEYRVATAGGISPSEIQRTSGDPRSGYSLSISRQGQREAQRKFSAVMRSTDERVMSKTASLCNRFLGEQLPESGYRVSYQSLPLSPEEMRAIREDVIQKLNAGLISPIDAIQMLNPDMDEEEARVKLNQIRRERAEFL